MNPSLILLSCLWLKYLFLRSINEQNMTMWVREFMRFVKFVLSSYIPCICFTTSLLTFPLGSLTQPIFLKFSLGSFVWWRHTLACCISVSSHDVRHIINKYGRAVLETTKYIHAITRTTALINHFPVYLIPWMQVNVSHPPDKPNSFLNLVSSSLVRYNSF